MQTIEALAEIETGETFAGTVHAAKPARLAGYFVSLCNGRTSQGMRGTGTAMNLTCKRCLAKVTI